MINEEFQGLLVEESRARKVNALSNAIRQRLTSADALFRKAYLELFANRIEVDDVAVRMKGSSKALGNASTNPAEMLGAAVFKFV